MKGFEELQRMYRGALEEKCLALEHEWRGLLAGAPPEPHALALRRQLHQLSGSAGAYGYEAMGEMARDLEKSWVQWLAQPEGRRPDALALVHELDPVMRALQAALLAEALPAEP